ncbi:hypothetical protein ERIC1_1c28810 [Paenibacillus larvae subsp. larvae DSM 25719]|nr:hypothetical protein ERIC1_1c28810 [Paenibacillus larvae subsp. larvae DSM 25719]
MFTEPNGIGPTSLLKKVGMSNDFKGLYVFWKMISLFYAGISRKVIRRIRQHCFRTKSLDASLAFNGSISQFDERKT